MNGSQNPLVKYENKWVVMSKDGKKVLFSSRKLENLLKKINSKDKDLILTKVLPFDISYAPYVARV